MNGNDFTSLFFIAIIGALILFLFYIIELSKGKKKDDIFNFEKDYKKATEKNTTITENEGDTTLLGKDMSNRNVYVSNSAKHVFVCGTTGSGKTVALANFIDSGIQNNYPILIIDGKGDTSDSSLLDIVKRLNEDKKVYCVNLNDPEHSDKYNPFQNTSADVIKDMLINMTNWSEEHYKYNTERYIQRLCNLLELSKIVVSLDSLTNYLATDNFLKLSKELNNKKVITKSEHIENMELSKTSGKIAESAAARFSTIKESSLGKIFNEDGIDIYTALKENAIIIFILNPLLYPEMSPLIGNLIVIDSKKAVSHFYSEKKKRIFYIMDEINVYASKSLVDLVNKSRSANVTCILATQSLSDLDYANGEHFKEQVIENCNNYILLRQNSPVNAEHWANILGTEQTMIPTYQIKNDNGATTGTDLGSLRPSRKYHYHPDTIKTLGTGYAIYLSRDTDNMKHTKLKVNKPF